MLGYLSIFASGMFTPEMAFSLCMSARRNVSSLNGAKDLPKVTAFNTGNACDVVLVRDFYRWLVFTPGLSFFLANMKARIICWPPPRHSGRRVA